MTRLLEIWPGVMAHASGGLWLKDSRTLVLADLHLGYGWAQRRRGELGPLADEQTRLKLIQVLDELAPLKLLLAGDIVHAAQPCAEESAFILRTLREIVGRTRLVGVKGNHDRQFAQDFAEIGIALTDDWREGPLRVAHGDRLPRALPEGELLAVGHLHPAIGLEDAAGVKQKVPAFLVAGRVVVLPAFSPFASGLDVWRSMPEEIAALGGGARPEAIAATGARVVRMGPLDRLTSPAQGSRPGDYRASK